MSRLARMILGLAKRHNDTLAQVDPAEMARQFRLPESLVRKCVEEEMRKRGAA